jgi:hypothetical protein
MTDTVLQAYRFALDPTPRQRRALASHCGAARYAHNWGLELLAPEEGVVEGAVELRKRR